MRLGTLEFGRAEGELPADVLRDTVARVREYDRIGLSRVWFGEHHRRVTAWAYPDPLVAVCAARTERIRLGTGCVLLGYRQPYRLASDFRLLGGLFGSRVELGVGSGKMNPERAAFQARSGFGRDDYETAVHELMGFLRAGSTTPEAHRGIHPSPVGGVAPGVWVMGMSERSGTLAAEAGASFCYALHPERNDPSALGTFRNRAGAGQRAAVALAAAWRANGHSCSGESLRGTLGGFDHIWYRGEVRGLVEELVRLREVYGVEEAIIVNRSPLRYSLVDSWRMLVEELDKVGVPSA